MRRPGGLNRHWRRGFFPPVGDMWALAAPPLPRAPGAPWHDAQAPRGTLSKLTETGDLVTGY